MTEVGQVTCSFIPGYFFSLLAGLNRAVVERLKRREYAAEERGCHVIFYLALNGQAMEMVISENRTLRWTEVVVT